jgi:type 1 fimbria pilin
MKPVFALAAAGFLPLAQTAFAQTVLPAGNYEVNGTVTSTSGNNCPLAANRPVTGHIYYPGVGSTNMQMVLESVAIGKTVTVGFVFAFPTVPASGLNGWTVANPASANYNQYQNGKLASGVTTAALTFDLIMNQQTYLPIAQGSVSISVDAVSPCAETVQALFTQVSPFKIFKD